MVILIVVCIFEIYQASPWMFCAGWWAGGFRLGGCGLSPLSVQAERALGCSLLVPWLGLLHLGPHGFCCFRNEVRPPDGGLNLGGVTVSSQLQHSPLPPSPVSRPGHGCPLQSLALLPRTWSSGHPAQHSGSRSRVPAGRLVLSQAALSHWGRVRGFGHGASGPEPVRWDSGVH